MSGNWFPLSFAHARRLQHAPRVALACLPSPRFAKGGRVNWSLQYHEQLDHDRQLATLTLLEIAGHLADAGNVRQSTSSFPGPARERTDWQAPPIAFSHSFHRCGVGGFFPNNVCIDWLQTRATLDLACQSICRLMLQRRVHPKPPAANASSWWLARFSIVVRNQLEPAIPQGYSEGTLFQEPLPCEL
jgi:hypothetical protein